MAQNDIEIEVKVKVTKAKFEKIKKEVKKLAKFAKRINHADYYYNLPHRDFLKPKYPYEWLSLRERGKKLLLNYKHWYPEGAKHTTHCDEYEILVNDKNQLTKILKVLGIKQMIRVSKKRETYIYKNMIEIAMDEVKGLGYFIEAEALKNQENIEETYGKLISFLNSLGIKKIKTVPGGYAAAMMRKKGLM
jgi:adenylate cyclase class 2